MDEEVQAETLTQRTRKAQLIEVTIALIAAEGYAGVSLSKIAARAEITKPAVLYYFCTTAGVVKAAYEHVLEQLVEHVGAAIDAAPAHEAVTSYAEAMIEYFSQHSDHTKVFIEALTYTDVKPESAARWQPLADLIQQARKARGLEPHADSRTIALIIGGAIDGIVTEKVQDPGYNTVAAASRLAALIEASFLSDET